MGTQKEQVNRAPESHSEEVRMVLVNAQALALSSNSNIGVGHIFTAVIMQMNTLEIINVLGQNGISLSRLTENLWYVKFDSEVIQEDQEIRLTSRTKDALRSVAETARHRKTSQVEPSDLLVGIAKYAEATRRKVDAQIERWEKEVEPFLIRKQLIRK